MILKLIRTFRFALFMNPLRKMHTIDPDMVGLIALVRGAHIEPVAQGTFRNLQFVSEFTDFIKQGE